MRRESQCKKIVLQVDIRVDIDHYTPGSLELAFLPQNVFEGDEAIQGQEISCRTSAVFLVHHCAKMVLLKLPLGLHKFSIH